MYAQFPLTCAVSTRLYCTYNCSCCTYDYISLCLLICLLCKQRHMFHVFFVRFPESNTWLKSTDCMFVFGETLLVRHITLRQISRILRSCTIVTWSSPLLSPFPPSPSPPLTLVWVCNTRTCWYVCYQRLRSLLRDIFAGVTRNVFSLYSRTFYYTIHPSC